MRIRFKATAFEEAEQIRSWWKENRPAAPTLFVDELESAIALLAAQPKAGRVARADQDLAGVRRLLLPRSRYHVYYSVDGDDLDVLAIWHASRGEEPPLR